MITIKGELNTAKVFTDNVESACLDQIRLMASTENFTNPIRIMPDCHAGKGSVVGFTMPIGDLGVCPNVVGVDIGCGVVAVDIGTEPFDLGALDDFIHENIPSGFKRHETVPKATSDTIECIMLNISAPFNREVAKLSVGTLGGGNHFISIEKSRETNHYHLIVHSGSRHLGVEIAAFYQHIAENSMHNSGTAKELRSLYSVDKLGYMNDMTWVTTYAKYNRQRIAGTILDFMGRNAIGVVESVHNYIGDDGIIRKGAISALQSECCIIPLNMRDGSLICVGKGNPDWNFSAPHGAGRILSRSKAKKNLSMDDYKNSMNGVFTTCVNEKTLDESPMVYKDSHEIEELLEPTATVVEHLVPIYNFKAN